MPNAMASNTLVTRNFAVSVTGVSEYWRLDDLYPMIASMIVKTAMTRMQVIGKSLTPRYVSRQSLLRQYLTPDRAYCSGRRVTIIAMTLPCCCVMVCSHCGEVSPVEVEGRRQSGCGVSVVSHGGSVASAVQVFLKRSFYGVTIMPHAGADVRPLSLPVSTTACLSPH